jgi:CheY-like chemotaxis protein
MGTVGALTPRRRPQASSGHPPGASALNSGSTMETAFTDGLPNDVLIVEDDPIIALDFEETIRSLGVKAVRTVASVARALEMIAEQTPDFALLDVGLVYEKSYAVAERLQALQVPFVFVTGYSSEVKLPTDFADKPRLPKPFTVEALQAVLQQHTGDRG